MRMKRWQVRVKRQYDDVEMVDHDAEKVDDG